MGVLVATCTGWGSIASPMACAVTIDWVRQLGGEESDDVHGISLDGLGNLYLSGRTPNDLGGPHAGNTDAFLSKYSVLGAHQWTRQLGSAEIDIGYGVSADPLGNVFMGGTTWGNLGGPLQGSPDGFLSSYDSAGNLRWVRQLGDDVTDARGVAADGLGNVYLSGWTRGDLAGRPHNGSFDAFVAKYDDQGNRLWYGQVATPSADVYGTSVATDAQGDVYVSGYTFGNLAGVNAGSRDAFLVKYSSSGARLWTRQFGTSASDRGEAVAADGLGNVFVVGATEGSLGGPNAGGPDVFVRKYNVAGNLLWTTQFGSDNFEEDLSAAADGLGNLYVSGATWGSLGGPTAGRTDAFLTKIDSAGNLLWSTQLGTSSSDGASGVAAGLSGHVFISGATAGTLGEVSHGRFDAFVARFSDPAVPEPAGLKLALLALIPALLSSRRIFPLFASTPSRTSEGEFA